MLIIEMSEPNTLESDLEHREPAPLQQLKTKGSKRNERGDDNCRQRDEDKLLVEVCSSLEQHSADTKDNIKEGGFIESIMVREESENRAARC